MAVHSVVFTQGKLKNIPCYLIVSAEEITIFEASTLSRLCGFATQLVQILPLRDRLSLEHGEYKCILYSEDVLSLYRSLRLCTNLFKTRINDRSYTVRVLPQHVVFESRSEKAVLLLDDKCKLIYDFNEVVITKLGSVIPVYFDTKQQCTTAITLMKLARHVLGAPPQESDLRLAFYRRVRTAGFWQQVEEADMTAPPGKMLSAESYFYKKLPKQKILSASQEASLMLKEQQALAESRMNESLSAAVIRRRRMKRRHKKQLSSTFDDTSLVFDANNDDEGYCQDRLMKELSDESESATKDSEPASHFFQKEQAEKTKKMLYLRTSFEEGDFAPRQDTAKHMDVYNAFDRPLEGALEMQQQAEVPETPMFQAVFSKYDPDLQ